MIAFDDCIVMTTALLSLSFFTRPSAIISTAFFIEYVVAFVLLSAMPSCFAEWHKYPEEKSTKSGAVAGH